MIATTDTAADRPGVFTQLDTIRMSNEQRRQAYASLHHAELIADLVPRAVADMRAITRYVEHAAAGLASGTFLPRPRKLAGIFVV